MKEYCFSSLRYVPTDFVKVQKKLDHLVEQIEVAGNEEEIIELMQEADALEEEVRYASQLTYIRSSLDCTDEFYKEAADREAVGQSMVNTAAYYKALLDSPHLCWLEERFGSELRPALKQRLQVDSQGHELKAREQVLINQYQVKKAGLRIPFRGKECSEGEMYVFFDDPDRQTRIEARKALSEAVLQKKEEFTEILSELIPLRDEIARVNGFSNYLEYANTMFSRRGYGEAEMTAFCKQVKEELVPFLRELEEDQRRTLGVEKLMVYDRGIRFADGNALPAGDASYLTQQSQKMYTSLSPEFGSFFRGMVESESLDVTSSPNKVAGMGFCTELKSDMYPYVFGNCNGTDTDVSVFTHEIGHAWQVYLTNQEVPLGILREMPLDVVEIPSKTMELFAFPYAEDFFGKDADKFRSGHFQAVLREIATYCAIHELETWIYTHVGASFEELVEKEREIARWYSPSLDYGELDAYNAKGADLMRNMAVYMLPRYVISYALSEMGAMDLFARMQENPSAAWESYVKLCASGGSRNYPDTCAVAGLEPSYNQGRVKKIVAFARAYRNEMEQK